ncbi:alpha/beta fold hydrolase [Williamsia sp. CHRR-6]|uniref:alpha/beta fold hydrolase n=1 Tax=Williamsia sp. CHRR-6 TaxID=2835871 RepID=UPI001BDAEDF2|nr:alpha/beta fold hydrolase [Williamsia sp. CHRR-6]MBT0566937.1 alpha/beta fold hydrolase [Williamsia sp. CHRR-6]
MHERAGHHEDRFLTLSTGIRLCFRDSAGDHRSGSTSDAGTETVLLIGGLGEDLTTWSQSYVSRLIAANHRVVRADNRDSGRSTFASTRPPALWRQALGVARSDAYTLADMGADLVELLDLLDVGRVHLIGRSMGGMIAQTIALMAPHRVASLTSVYSTTGAKDVGRPALSTMALMAAPAPRTRVGFVRNHLRMTDHLAGRAHPIDEVAEAALAAGMWDRCGDDLAAGSARQVEAISASPDRTSALRGLRVPTLVLHGDRDLIVHPSGGRATADAVPGARFVELVGAGHHLPESLGDEFFGHVLPHLEAASSLATQESS